MISVAVIVSSMHLQSTLEQWLTGLGVSAWPFLVGWLLVSVAGHGGGHCYSMFITYKNKNYWLVERSKKRNLYVYKT